MNNINMNKLLALFTVLATFLATSYGKTIYVNANFPTAGNGTDWSSPYTNLQDAVTASVAGDLVLVTNGVYSPISTENKAITIQSVNGHSDTIIDGGGVARCATLGTGVVLKGFMVRNGYVSGHGGGVYYGSVYDSMISNNLATGNGGGAYNSALVSNCVVVGNIARGTRDWDGGGGTYNCTTVMDSLISGNIATNGTYTKGGGSYLGTLYRCRVENNLGKQGGGVSNSHVYDSVIYGNESFVNNGWGGGYWAASTTYNVSNCVISSNSAPSAGGISGGTLRNCVVSNNVATVSYGGGVRDAMVYDSLIVNNSAKTNGGGSYGGTLIGCTISGNTAEINGGGSNGGTLTGCTISGNTAAIFGGGSNGGTLTGCTISGNTANARGGGSWASILFNTIVSNNIAIINGGGCYNGTLNSCLVVGNIAPVGSQIRNQDVNFFAYNSTIIGECSFPNTTRDIFNNIFYGANVTFPVTAQVGFNIFSGTLTGGTIIGPNLTSTDPLFTDPLNNDFSLRPESPCINMGANQYVTTATDLAGRHRIKDWRVDMGAYENQSQRFAVTPNPLYPMGRAQIDVTLDDYVQDGLIQHFDGHVLDPAVKVWPQLVEGQPNHFAPYYDNASMYNAYTLVPGVGMVFDTNGTYRSRPRFYTDSFAFFGSNGPPGTVEMCVTQKPNPPNTVAAMSGQSGGRGLTMMRIHSTNPIWGIYATVYPWFEGGQPKVSNPTAFETNMLITTSAIMDKGLLSSVFVNGVQKTVSSPGQVVGGSRPSWPVYIGGDNSFTGGGFVGTVHAIRIYDRKLEPWEVEKNRKLDERRF